MRQYKLSIRQDGMHSAMNGWWTSVPSRHSRRSTMSKILAVLPCLAIGLVQAADPTLTTFAKQHLTPQFMSEGATFGDFNRDGKQDVVSGPFWYAGPTFTDKFPIYPAMAYDPKNYSANFLAFAYDVNKDHFDDVVVFGFPGKEVLWYQNSGTDQLWTKHVILDIADNESPTWIDITGDSKPEVVCTRRGFIGYAQADWDNPTTPWIWHNISTKGGWHKFTHGLGVGDVNGDGRLDVIMREGWWEQPTMLAGDPEWIFHASDFGAGGAQMLVYDVDGDGRNDVITSLTAHEWGLAWFQQQADGSFVRQLIMGKEKTDSPYGVRFSQLHAMALSDIDGDGLQDIVTGKRYWAHGPKGDPEPNEPAVLYWFRLTRTAAGVQYVPMKIDDDSGVGTQLTVGDLNGDKHPDIIVGNKKGTFVFLHQTKPVSLAEWDAAQPKLTR